MQKIYDDIRALVKNLVKEVKTPSFYEKCDLYLNKSSEFFNNDTKLLKIKDLVSSRLSEEWGHGTAHSYKVAIEAGALILMEAERQGFDKKTEKKLLTLVQSAGLVHDICREEKNHAEAGALAASDLLKEDFKEEDLLDLCEAVRRHEAFKTYSEQGLTFQAELLSSCLYDADKFRWGPDNFQYTIWSMLEAADISVYMFLKAYPKGLAGVARIAGTFRSYYGRSFGPEFIDIGMDIGSRLYVLLMERYGKDQEK